VGIKTKVKRWRNAVYDAIGVQIMDLPITAEKIYGALQAKK
jgi:CO/xanthine dehydrogenase Mo-binding subunit